MDFGGNHAAADELASLIGWWEDAGVDTAIGEAARDWLARVEPPVMPAPVAPAAAHGAAPATPQKPAASASLPDTLAGFQQWLATSDTIAMPLSARIAPAGDAATGLMVLLDLPEEDDVGAGKLVSGPAGDLFDRMLAAMGQSRDSLYLAAMAPGRPAGGYVDKAAGTMFGKLARHHVALAKPRALLLMGEAPSRAFLDLGFVEARGRTHAIEVNGVATTAVATFHPRTLLQHPQQKKRAWEDLQLLMKILG